MKYVILWLRDSGATSYGRHQRERRDPHRALSESGRSAPRSGPFGAPGGTIIVLQEDADEPVEEVGIEQKDGSLIIRLDGRKAQERRPGGAKLHDANLGEYIDENELARICDELARMGSTPICSPDRTGSKEEPPGSST